MTIRSITESDLDTNPYITCETIAGGAVLVMLPTADPAVIRFYDLDADPWSLLAEYDRPVLVEVADRRASLALNFGYDIQLDVATVAAIAGWIRDINDNQGRNHHG